MYLKGVGSKLWTSDGTAIGTQIIESNLTLYNSGTGSQLNIDETFYFYAGGAAGTGLWKTDGTPESAEFLDSVQPANFVNVSGRLFYSGATPETGQELRVSDGTVGGTGLVADLTPGSAHTPMMHGVALNGTYYFSAKIGAQFELWRSDGTEAGTQPVFDLPDGMGDIRNVSEANGKIFSLVAKANAVQSLWATDPVAGTTELLKEFELPAQYPSSNYPAANFNGLLYFTGSDLIHGTELWISDGTAAGTTLFADLNPTDNSSISIISGFVDQLFIQANNKLWNSDGTAAQTKPVTGGISTTVPVIDVGSSFYTINWFPSVGPQVTRLFPYVNEAPTSINLSATSVAENLPSGTSVGTFSTDDPNPIDEFTYSLVSGIGSGNNAVFTISGNTLKTAASFNYEARSSYSIRVRSTDAEGVFVEQVFTISVTNENDPPVLKNLGGILVYSENQKAQALSGGAIVTDFDSPDFAFGTLNVSIASGVDANDRLEIRNVGVGPGQIGWSGHEVTYGGIYFADFQGGTGVTPLALSFNENSSVAAVQALVRSITFRTLGDNIVSGMRTLNYVLNDADSFLNATGVKLVSAAAVNDRPIIAMGGTILFREGWGPQVLASFSAALSDPDSSDFDGGKLTVRIAEHVTAEDRLTIGTRSGLSISGSDVLSGGVVFAAFTGASAINRWWSHWMRMQVQTG